jgi:TRAP-type uncharacterized transport system substrate-binding protein
MKNRMLLVLLAIVLTLTLVAFAACKAEEASLVEEEEEEVWQWPKKIILAATGTDHPSYSCAIAWSTPLAKDIGVTIRVVATGQRSVRQRYLESGAYLASGESVGGRHILAADEEYATREGGPWQLRIFYPLGTTNQGWIMRGDSDINTCRDLKPGMKFSSIGWLPGKPSWGYEGPLAWADLDEEDVIFVPAANKTAMINYLLEGKTDMSFAFFTNSPFLYEAEASPYGIKWLDLNAEEDPEGAARFRVASPSFKVLGPMTTGVPSCRGIWGTVSLGAYNCSANADPELVYRVVKWLSENNDKYVDAHPWGPDMTPATLLKISESSYLPLHRGSKRYLEEIGLWTDRHEARWQQNLALITEYVEGYQAAIDLADEQGIDVNPGNREWLDFWYDYRGNNITPFPTYYGLD